MQARVSGLPPAAAGLELSGWKPPQQRRKAPQTARGFNGSRSARPARDAGFTVAERRSFGRAQGLG
jgi:hypothetical protein